MMSPIANPRLRAMLATQSSDLTTEEQLALAREMIAARAVCNAVSTAIEEPGEHHEWLRLAVKAWREAAR
jgi:hypothetical protein